MGILFLTLLLVTTESQHSWTQVSYGQSYCVNTISSAASNGFTDCRNRCISYSNCNFYSFWYSGGVNWCRLSSSCSSKGTQDHSIVIYAKQETKCTGSLIIPDNGSVTKDNGDKHSSVATFSCNAGFARSGTTSVTCSAASADAPWPSDTATCTLCLAQTGCKAGKSTANTCSTGIGVTDKLVCTEADAGYFLVGTGDSAIVAETKCTGTPITPDNGSIIKDNADKHNSMITFSCNNGFMKSATASVTCSATSANTPWPSATVTCTPCLAQTGCKAGKSTTDKCSTGSGVTDKLICTEADAGYFLVGSGDSAIVTAYSCTEGVLVNNSQCKTCQPVSQRTANSHCKTCNTYHYLNGKVCIKRSCAAGQYIHSNGNCQPWAGSCSNGSIITQSSRTKDNHCGSCNNRYYLVNKACVACTAQATIDCTVSGTTCVSGFPATVALGLGKLKCATAAVGKYVDSTGLGIVQYTPRGTCTGGSLTACGLQDADTAQDAVIADLRTTVTTMSDLVAELAANNSMLVARIEELESRCGSGNRRALGSGCGPSTGESGSLDKDDHFFLAMEASTAYVHSSFLTATVLLGGVYGF